MSAIPVWPALPEGKVFFTNARTIFETFKSFGVSDMFAIGMLANAEAESSLDPNAMGDREDNRNPTAFGLFQWHRDRLIAIKTALGTDIEAEARGGRGTTQTQIEAAWWELNTFSSYGKAAIEAAKTAYMAAYEACALFERAGAAAAADRRGQMAVRWLAYFGRNA
jgi:Phage tail lysozyme